MRVQTPFYVIKRLAVTKEAAGALSITLSGNPDSAHLSLQDMIDFCLSPKEEKVFLSIGDKVLLKDNAGWQHCMPTSGEAVLVSVCLAEEGRLRLQFDTEDDFNSVRLDNPDLSDYVELI